MWRFGQIKNETHNNDIVIKKLDLASFKSIEAFVKDVYETEERLDILINNAGVLANSYRKTEDGFELHFGINFLGHFLLTNLLLDLLKKSSPSRIIHVSSIGHRYGNIHWDDLNMERCFNGVDAYSQSKLMNILFSLELSKRLEGTGVTSNSLHPGAVNTDIFRESDGCCSHGGCIGFWISLAAMCRGCMSPPHKGAETVVYCATNPELASTSGRYFRNRKLKREAANARNEDDANKLWQRSEQLTQLTQKLLSISY